MADGRVHLHAGPAFCRAGGVWRRIADVLTVGRDKLGTYRIECDREWITFAPRVRPAGQLRRAVVETHRFGDILDATRKPDVAEYDVRHSAGVKPVATGWRFANVAEPDVGVFLTDWLRRFGAGRVTVAADRAAVDLRDVDADAKGEINLDPETVPSGSGIHFYNYHNGEYSTSDAWSACRDELQSSCTPAIGWDGRCAAITYVGYFDTAEMRRQVLEFDTSAFPAAGKVCRLRLDHTDWVYDEMDEFAAVRLDPPAVVDPEGNVQDALNVWLAVSAAADAGSGGVCEHLAGASWQSPDMIASGDYAQATAFQLAVMAGHDYRNEPLTTHMSKGRQFDAAAAYLELTDAPRRAGRPIRIGARSGYLGGPGL